MSSEQRRARHARTQNAAAQLLYEYGYSPETRFFGPLRVHNRPTDLAGGARTRRMRVATAQLTSSTTPPTATPRLATTQLIRFLTYDFNVRDTLINAVVLTTVLIALIVATACTTLALSAVFWVPFALFIAALQCVVTYLTEQQGFSLVWCALSGLGIYEELQWRVFSSAGSASSGIAITAACACALAVAYYTAEEACTSYGRVELSPQVRPPKRWLLQLWGRLGTTCVHACTIGVGAGAARVADVAPGRTAAFYTALALGLSCLIILIGLMGRSRRVGGAAVHPDAPAAGSPSSDELAIASLQMQLLRTRDEMSRMRYERAKSTYALAGEAAEAAEATAAPVGGAPTGGLDDELARLVRREATLLERLALRAGQGGAQLGAQLEATPTADADGGSIRGRPLPGTPSSEDGLVA